MTTPSAGTVRFNYHRDIEWAYNQGDCWYFAETIRDLTGYPIITAQWDEEPMAVYHARTETWWRSPGGSYWTHAANRLPDGRILDIQGIWEAEEWLKRWHNLSINHCKSNTMFVKEWSKEEWCSEIIENGMEIRFREIFPLAETYAKKVLTHV